MLTESEKRDLIKGLCNNIRDDLVSQVKNMPPEWDGYELRAILALKFEASTAKKWGKGDRKRDAALRRAIANGVIR